jgi:Tol biopolymer transport system component
VVQFHRPTHPSWYPDGERIAVKDAATYSIKRIDLPKGLVTTMTDPARVYAGMPSVSPDGKWIAFAGQQNRGPLIAGSIYARR